MSPERRVHARRTLYSPEYLDMGADNGGVVVNLSEGGLGFQAIGPVNPDSEIALSFSLGPAYRIDVNARVVWVDAQGKLGGAVFGLLSKDSRSLIHEWLSTPSQHELETGAPASAPGGEVETREPEGEPALYPTEAATIPAHEPNQNPANEGVVEHSRFAQMDEARAHSGMEPPPRDLQFTERPAPALADQPGQVHSDVPPISTAMLSGGTAMERLVPGTEYTDLPQEAAATLAEPRHDEVPVATASKPQDASVTPFASRVAAPPPPAPEQTPARQAAASFSVVPSTSAWARKDEPATADASMGAASKPNVPLFPPRNAENIFGRTRSAASHVEPEPSHRRGSALLILAIVIAAGAVVASYVRTHRQQIGDALVHMGNTVAGGTSTAGTPSAPPGNTNSAASSTSTGDQRAAATVPVVGGKQLPPTSSPSGTPPQAQTPSSNTAAQPNSGVRASAAAGSTGGQPSGQGAAAPTAQFGLSEYDRAEQYLNGTKGVTQDPAEAAEWFWRSLEAGDTNAAIPLADLYVAGNGVSRSCTQAHILLDLAARKGNGEAAKKLAQLPENCQ
jgi:TPR repeat protein